MGGWPVARRKFSRWNRVSAIAVALSFYGVPQDEAAAVALVDRGISILTVIVIGGIVYLLSAKVRRAHGVASAGSPG